MTKIKKEYIDKAYMSEITSTPKQNALVAVLDEDSSNYGIKYAQEAYDPSEPVENIVGANHKFSIIRPTSLADMDLTVPLIKFPSYYSIEPTFEYLSTQWEEAMALLQETHIPNVYIENTSHLQESMAFPGVQLDRELIKNYKKRIGDSYAPRATRGEALKNIVFLDPIEDQADKASRRFDYPFYNKITIYERNDNVDQRDKLVDLSLMGPLIRSFITETRPLVKFNSTDLNGNKEDQSFEAFDYLKWLKSRWPESYELTEIKIDPPQPVDFLQPLSRIDAFTFAFKGYPTSGINSRPKKRRSVKDIADGIDCYTETLFYKIEKRNRTTGEFIQCFYIAAQDKEINLFDTQIKYGVEYEYICFSCKLVFGSNVEIAPDPVIIGTGDGQNRKYLNNSPSIQLITAELFRDSCAVMQPPQPMPDVSFFNNKFISNKIKIMASLNANRYVQDFIPLAPDEETQTEIINEKYRKRRLKDYFHFESEHALFEVFRMDRQPRSYSEFRDSKIAEFKNSVPSTSAFFEDSILIDKDYYYILRSVNTHGFLSNPTAIYKVRQTKDADETFLSVETIGFLEEDLFQKTLKFQKLLQLVPGTLHTVYNLKKEQGFDQETLKGKVDQLSLGMASEPVWGKKFKLRVTSTDTGKKIDLNVTVKLTKHKTSEDL